jgi:hypothetical protein
MSVLFNIQLESDLSEFIGTVTDGGDLSQGSPGLAGTAGRLECLVDDTTSIYGWKDFGPVSTDDFRLRFYIDPNAFDKVDGEYTSVIYVHDADDTALGIVYARLTGDGSSHEINIYTKEDDKTNHFSGTYDITDAEHYVEIYVERASSNVAGDGDCTLWIDKVQKWNQGGTLDNYDMFPLQDRVRAGAFSFVGTPEGTLLLDEIKANDDGSEIGPRVGVPIFMHHYRRLREQG